MYVSSHGEIINGLQKRNNKRNEAKCINHTYDEGGYFHVHRMRFCENRKEMLTNQGDKCAAI